MGDIYNYESNICVPCPNNTFTNSDPYLNTTACQICPDNMWCFGGADSVPQPKYYKPSVNSTKAYLCPNPSSCLGGLIDNNLSLTGYCKPPTAGLLCSNCEDGYVRSDDGRSCISCSLDWVQYLEFTGKVLLSIGLVVFELFYKISKGNRLKQAYESNDKERIESCKSMFDSSTVVKMIMQFSQLVTIIKVINFGWTESLEQFYQVQSQIIPVLVNEFSFNCLLKFTGISGDKLFFFEYIALTL